MGLSDDAGFAKYHQVLNRAVWSPLQMSRVLLMLLIEHLAQDGEPLVFGIDETLERRRGSRISAKGVFRDAVRSSESHLVRASGLRRVSLMWLAHIPWANRTWALPVMTALAPAESYHQKVGRPHKKITDWARQMIIQLRRWLPDRRIVVVADRGYAALELLHSCQSLRQPVTFISGLRLDAALFEPAPPRMPGQIGRPRLKGQRLPSPIELLDNPDVSWTRVSVPWKDGPARTLEITSETAVWYRWGRPPVHIRWVLIRDPLCQMRTQALVCTDTEADPPSDRPMVSTALAHRGHLPGGTRPPWSRDSAPVVRQGYLSHHAFAAGTVLPGLLSPPGCCGRNARLPCVRAPGMPSVSPPSSMRSRWCAGTCGLLLRLYPHPRPSLMWRKSLCLYSIVLWIPLPTQLERLYICLLRLL